MIYEVECWMNKFIKYIKQKWINYCKRVVENPVPYLPIIIFVGVITFCIGFIYEKIRIK